MTDLHEHTSRFRPPDQVVRFLDGRGDRFFDQNVFARCDAVAGDRMVRCRRGDNADRIDLIEDGPVIGRRLASVLQAISSAPVRFVSTTATSSASGSSA
jgi:hypothetical protein